MADLAGKRALVTGSGMGIGRGIAIELARQGAAVAVHHPPIESDADETVAEVERLGAKHIVVRGDLREVSECERVVEETANSLGGLDVLVNNAGVTRALPFLETEEPVYDEMFDLNMKGSFFCAKRAVPYMLEAGGGSIINITSIHGHGGFPNHTAYAATKGAVIAFTRQLAIELSDRNVRVNAIGPGLIEVPRYFDIPGYTTEFGDTLVPMGRIGHPEDVAPTVAFLASDAARFITGQTLYIDGGTTARMGLWWEQADEPR